MAPSSVSACPHRPRLHADAGALQWIVNAYLLPLSALLLLGGAAGDTYGRRRLLVLGTLLFAAASLACALAPNLPVLLAGRALQGLGAAMLMPSSLAILGSAFEGEAKGRAIGVWAASSAAMGAAGPVLGGWLIDTAGWRLIFLINLPLAFGAVLLAWRFVQRDEDVRDRKLDSWGGLLAPLGLGAATWALTEGSGPAGWTIAAMATAGVAIALLMAFIAVERRRGEAAMMPLSLFGSCIFVGLTLLTLLLYGALGGLFVLLPFLPIQSAGYSATQAGAALLPLPVLLAISSPSMGALAGRIGSRLPLTVGPLVTACGFALMLRIGACRLLDAGAARFAGDRRRPVRRRGTTHHRRPLIGRRASHGLRLRPEQRRRPHRRPGGHGPAGLHPRCERGPAPRRFPHGRPRGRRRMHFGRSVDPSARQERGLKERHPRLTGFSAST